MNARTVEVRLEPPRCPSIIEHYACRLTPSETQISSIASQLTCSRRRLVRRPLIVTFRLNRRFFIATTISPALWLTQSCSLQLWLALCRPRREYNKSRSSLKSAQSPHTEITPTLTAANCMFVAWTRIRHQPVNSPVMHTICLIYVIVSNSSKVILLHEIMQELTNITYKTQDITNI